MSRYFRHLALCVLLASNVLNGVAPALGQMPYHRYRPYWTSHRSSRRLPGRLTRKHPRVRAN